MCRKLWLILALCRASAGADSSARYIYGTPGAEAEDFANDYGYVFMPYSD